MTEVKSKPMRKTATPADRDKRLNRDLHLIAETILGASRDHFGAIELTDAIVVFGGNAFGGDPYGQLPHFDYSEKFQELVTMIGFKHSGHYRDPVFGIWVYAFNMRPNDSPAMPNAKSFELLKAAVSLAYQASLPK